MKKVNLKKEMIHYEGSTQLTHLTEDFHQASLQQKSYKHNQVFKNFWKHYKSMASIFLVTMLQETTKFRKNKKYNCSGPPASKSQRVGYQSNQKLLHHC